MTAPVRRLAAFLAEYDPAIARQARAARAKLRRLLPGAQELVYDNYNALAIGYAPSERASEAVISVALYPRWVTLFFLRGVELADPHRLLRGSGSRVRHIVLETPSLLDDPRVRALVAAAREQVAWPAGAKARTVVKSVSARRRPRRRA